MSSTDSYPAPRPEAGALEVVLATFNGAAYLDEMLASLAAQSVLPPTLRVCDDGSRDDTRAVLDRWREVLPIVWLDAPPGAGACRNFARLLAASEADYVMLADQDDVWDPDKIACAMHEMAALEARWGRTVPLLVHGDTRLVDEALRPLAPSFFDFQRLDPHADGFARLLLQNVVTGCTVLVNRALLQLALPVPDAAPMHDWWLALVASAFGHIGFVRRPTVGYRQHGGNAIGARGWSARYLAERARCLLSRRGAMLLLEPCMAQARAFDARYRERLSERQRLDLRWLVHLPSRTPLQRIGAALRAGAHKHGMARTLGFYWTLLWGRVRGP
ncbi:abequosyltransferase RfbV [mine drainage metagenome]|uniref:Abequosyltransferase RfbV n=1 Tax=mine drainage metagenome TaxID=410659 RepID=A0A1J5SV61_9ZZZZ